MKILRIPTLEVMLYMLRFGQIHFRIWTNTERGVWRQAGRAEAAVHTVSAGRPVAWQGTLF